METVKVRERNRAPMIISRSQATLARSRLPPFADFRRPSLPTLQRRSRPELSPKTDSKLPRGRRCVDQLLGDLNLENSPANPTKGSSTATRRTSTGRDEGRRFVAVLPSRESRDRRKGGEGLLSGSDGCSGRRWVRRSKEGSRRLEWIRRRDLKSVDRLWEESARRDRRRSSGRLWKFPRPREGGWS